MIGPPLFVSSQRDGKPSAAAGTRVTGFIVRSPSGSWLVRGSDAAPFLRFELGEPPLRSRRRGTPGVLLDELAVLLDGALRVALRLERAPGAEQRLGGLLGKVVQHRDLEELRQRRLVGLRRVVQAAELEVRARREHAPVEREGALERALRLARAVEVGERAPAGEL